LLPVSTPPAVPVEKFAAGTGGKFATYVVNTGGKFATCLVDTVKLSLLSLTLTYS
jgi:hypothetical protein